MENGTEKARMPDGFDIGLFDDFEITNLEGGQHVVSSLLLFVKNLYSTYVEKAKLLESISDCFPVMLWAKDKDGKYLYANKMYSSWLGVYDGESALGHDDLYFASRSRLQNPNDPSFHTFGEVCGDSDKVVLKSLKTERFLEIGNVRGSYCALQVHKSPYFDESGNILGVVGAGIDITERVLDRDRLYSLICNFVSSHPDVEGFKVILEAYRSYCDKFLFLSNIGGE